MRMMKKSLIWIVSTVLVILCAACSTEPESTDTTETVLHLTCWIEDMELDRLIEEFENEHPNVTIKVKAYYDDKSDFSIATSRMNAEIATGNSADLYYLENAMDVMSLINVGLLADLYPLMQADESFHSEKYYENIWKAMELNGKLYEMPAGFQIGTIMGPQKLLGDRNGWTISDYNTFAAQQPDPETLLPKNRSYMLSCMTSYAMFDYIDLNSASCSFDSASFVKWLEFVGSFPGYVDDSVATEAQLRAGWFSGMYEYIQRRDEYGDVLQFTGFPCDSAPGPCIETMTSFGISAQTKQTELCWEFIKMMLSQEYQEQVVAYGAFPMRKSVFEDQLSASMLPPEEKNALVSSDSLLGPLSKDETERLQKLVEDLSIVRFRYADVTNIIEEEAEGYFRGEKSAEDTSKVIQNRVEIYLSEHS